MRDLYLPGQVQAMDQRAFDRAVDPAELMDRAAGLLARGVMAVANRRAGLRVVLLCGKGNNGGDGIAAARHLADREAEPVVVLVSSPDQLGDDASRELSTWQGRSGATIVLDDDPGAALAEVLAWADVAVDCLLGTGASGAPRGVMADVVEALGDFPGPVVACDIPTGVDGASGAVPGPAVRADLTVTLGAHKRGLSLSPGQDFTGRVVLGELDVVDGQAEPVAQVLEPDDLQSLLPAIGAQAEKRQRGVVVIYAGAEGTSGAAILTARGALRAGAGLVTVATPAAVAPIVAGAVPEAMTVALPADVAGIVRIVADAVARADVLALGPGLGLADQTQRAVRELVATVQAPVVLDADGLNAFRGRADDLADAASDTLVATPHQRELARLAGVTAEDVEARRADIAAEHAASWGVTVMAKGPATVIAAPDGRVWINPTGGPALATGGTGDVLAGVTAALVAGRARPESAACAAYLHGLAGDLAGESVGVRATTAGTVIDHLGPAAMTVGV